MKKLKSLNLGKSLNREEMKTINVKKLNPFAMIPTRAYSTDAGLDLYTLEQYVLNPGEVVKVSTGIAVEVPEGYVGLVRDRSSVGSRGLKVTAGIIDAGYTGEINVVLVNISNRMQKIEFPSKVAQLLIVPVETPVAVEVDEFKTSARGSKGFGSSDK